MSMTNQDPPSPGTQARSRAPMQLVGERQTPDAPSSTPRSETLQETIQRATTPTPTNVQAEFVHRRAWKAGVLASINVLVMVLAARMLVLVAIGGAIALTWYALESPDPYRLIALGIYSLLVVVPSVILAAMGR
jgi:hypothetical protein